MPTHVVILGDAGFIAESTDDALTFNTKIEDIFRAIDDFPDDDIVVICRSYHSLLKDLVDECESLFGDQP